MKGLATKGAQDTLRDKRVSLNSSPETRGVLPSRHTSITSGNLTNPQGCQAAALPAVKDPELEGLTGAWGALPLCPGTGAKGQVVCKSRGAENPTF